MFVQVNRKPQTVSQIATKRDIPLVSNLNVAKLVFEG